MIGKPNVGKSSLINKIAGEERVIVSDIAGTTRDATDTSHRKRARQISYLSIPPASAARARWKKRWSVTAFCGLIWRWIAADVAVIVIDATDGFTEQDSKVAGYAHEQGKGCVVAVNKWDAGGKRREHHERI